MERRCLLLLLRVEKHASREAGIHRQHANRLLELLLLLLVKGSADVHVAGCVARIQH